MRKLDKAGYDLITEFEGIRLKPYQDSIGVWTIGIGSTFYPDGTRVTKYDPPITENYAKLMFKTVADRFAKEVDKLVKSKINQNQFNSLSSIAYNIGIGNFKSSGLLKKVNDNPDDKTIATSFSGWNKAGGKVVSGLTTRRKKESDLYFKK